MTTAAIYLRKSNKSKGTGKQHQRMACVDYAKAQGWDTVEYNEPQGYTGWDLDRPVWAQMVQDAKAGKIHTVVAYEQSRVGRNIEIMSAAQRQITPLNIFFVAEGTTSGAEAGTDDRLRYNLYNLVYEQEHANAKRRMMAGKDLKRKTGEIFVGSEPYGYRYAGAKRFEVDPETGPVVQRVFKMYLEGLSIKQIAAQFIKEGATGGRVSKEQRAKGVIPVPTSPPAISRILQNRVYVDGTMVRNQKEHKKQGNRAPVMVDEQGNVVLKDREQWMDYSMPPLVSPEVWDAAQRRRGLNNHKSRPGQYGSAESMARLWARDRLYCAHCGSKLKGRIQRSGGKTYEYYTCHLSRCSKADLITRGREQLCELPTIQADDVHARVWDMVHAALVLGDTSSGGLTLYPQYDAAKLGPVITGADYEAKLANIQKRIEAAKAEREAAHHSVQHVLKKMADPDNDEEDSLYFRQELSAAKARRSTAEAEATRLEGMYQQVQDDRDNDTLRAQLAEYGPIVLAQVAERLRKLGPADKKRLVDAMVEQILVDGKKGPHGGRVDRGTLWTIKPVDLKPGRALGILNELRLEGKLDVSVHSLNGNDSGNLFNLMDCLENLYKLAA